MNDPVKILLAQASDLLSPFAENSRYRSVEQLTVTLPDGRPARCVGRRWLPQPEELATLAEHRLALGDRLDNLAHRYLGDPELFWRICDANRTLRPADLTDAPPWDERRVPAAQRVIRIGLPPGMPEQGPSFG